MEYAVKLLEDMLKIYSPTGYESKLAGYLEEAMKNLGFNVKRDEWGNVLGDIGKSGDLKVLLCGHMDTVPGEIPVRRVGSSIYGRGAVDAKGPLAAMIMAAYKAGLEKVNAEVTVACLVDEEGESRGAKGLAATMKPPDYAVFGEPSGTDGIAIGYKGSLKVLMEISTRSGHSASPWLYPNAIEEAFELWKTIKHEILEEKEDSHFYSVTGCLTRIEGGERFSTIPSKCRMELDFRIPPRLKWDAVYSAIEKTALAYAKEKKYLKIHVEGKGGVNAFLTSKDSPLVSAFSIAIRKIRGRQPILIKKTGTADLNILVQDWRIPMVAYGPGDSKLDHTANEHLDIREYLSSIEVLKEAVEWLTKIHKRSENNNKGSRQTYDDK